MGKLKRILLYVALLIGFWILSDILIQVSLNSSYKPIEQVSGNNQIDIYQAEATMINGRIKGVIRNSEQNNISNKYMILQLYDDDNEIVGQECMEIGELEPNGVKLIELYFKEKNIKSYGVEFSDTKIENEKVPLINLINSDLTKGDILLGVLTIIVFW